MAYSFPVFRRGMIFKTGRLVTSGEAARIADRIKSESELYELAFRSALVHNNGSIGWEDNDTQPDEERLEPKQVKQYSAESYILDFPSIAFRYNGFTVQSRNSVTVCRNQHRSKIWTRLSCSRFGNDKTELGAAEVRKFFAFAAANADRILSSLAMTYMEHLKQAGLALPNVGAYFFRFRAFNSNSDTCRELFEKLQKGLGVTQALDDKRYRPELMDYFEIALGKKVSAHEIKKTIRSGDLDVFGYKSPEHDALFTARVNETETDVCGYGYDVKDTLKSNVLSHAATKDLLKEYAQNF